MDISAINWYNILFPQDEAWYLFLKFFFVAIDTAAVVFIIYVLLKTDYLQKWFLWDWMEFFNYHSYAMRRVTKDWNKIIRRVKTNLDTEFKLAVIEADLLFNEVLKRCGYSGKTLKEKLDKVRPDALSDIDSIRQADQIYQKLLRDSKYKLDYEQTKKIIKTFEKGLKDLGAF